MINVRFIKKNNKIVSFNINGHADSVDEGYDLVCCAVSSISITIANGITEVAKVNALVDVKDGFLNVDLRNLSNEDIHRCQILMETMLLGLESMQESYDKYINVKVEEV